MPATCPGLPPHPPHYFLPCTMCHSYTHEASHGGDPAEGRACTGSSTATSQWPRRPRLAGPREPPPNHRAWMVHAQPQGWTLLLISLKPPMKATLHPTSQGQETRQREGDVPTATRMRSGGGGDPKSGKSLYSSTLFSHPWLVSLLA